jgi:prevent-host-death family protein
MSMKNVNIHAAKSQLSRLIADVLAGEEVVISKAGMPLVRLVPVASGEGPRPLGILAGAVMEADDCWAVDDDTEALLYNGAVDLSPATRVAEDVQPWYAKPPMP